MSCFLSVLRTCLGLILSPANRRPVLKPSLGYSEQDTRLRQGESSFIPRYWWCCSGPPHRSLNPHHHELEHDHLGVYYSSDQSCWNDRISAVLWVFVRAFFPASLLFYSTQNVRLSITVQCPHSSTLSFLTLSDTGVRFTALQWRCTADCVKG